MGFRAHPSVSAYILPSEYPGFRQQDPDISDTWACWIRHNPTVGMRRTQQCIAPSST
ncbi:unnamed protein product, partial [Adineta ricciae]